MEMEEDISGWMGIRRMERGVSVLVRGSSGCRRRFGSEMQKWRDTVKTQNSRIGRTEKQGKPIV